MKIVNIMEKLKVGDYIYLKILKHTIKINNETLKGKGNNILRGSERFATKEEIKKYNENS